MQKQYTWSKIMGIEIEEDAERLKITWPVTRNWPLFILFSASMLIWIFLLLGMIGAIWRGQYSPLLTTMLVVWLLIWAWFGRVLWARWTYVAATREILFVTADRLIIRRPVSILGATDAYDLAHVSPFYISDKFLCPAFDYGFQNVYFGQSLADESVQKLVSALNGRYFPHAVGDD